MSRAINSRRTRKPIIPQRKRSRRYFHRDTPPKNKRRFGLCRPTALSKTKRKNGIARATASARACVKLAWSLLRAQLSSRGNSKASVGVGRSWTPTFDAINAAAIFAAHIAAYSRRRRAKWFFVTSTTARRWSALTHGQRGTTKTERRKGNEREN